MIDAEHSYFQPAIDHAAMEVQRRFNTREPVVYNTYQCYLKDSSARYASLPQHQGKKFEQLVVPVRLALLQLDRTSPI